MLMKELALLVKEKRIIRPVGGCGKDEHTYFPYDERRGKREHLVFPEGTGHGWSRHLFRTGLAVNSLLHPKNPV